jgi:hypothetical protein
VFDTGLILSWTPNEYKAFIRGAQYREIDDYERMARSAMFNRYAANAKKASLKKMFDADKARKRLENNDPKWKDSKETVFKREHYNRMRQALKGFTPNFSTKGGK